LKALLKRSHHPYQYIHCCQHSSNHQNWSPVTSL
jgi:hypothetical protein